MPASCSARWWVRLLLSGGVIVGAVGVNLGGWLRRVLGADDRDRRLDAIEGELRPNGGSSLRDSVDRAELKTAVTDKRLSTYVASEAIDRNARRVQLDGRLDQIDGRLAVGGERMARIEGRLWPADPDDTDGET